MTQQSKAEYIQTLFYSLIKQKISFNQKFEILIFSEEKFKPLYPKELAKQFVIKHYYYKRPFNIGSVRNLIAQVAQGEYIIYLDDDVLIGPHYLKILISMIQKEKSAVIAGLTFQVFRRPKEVLELFQTNSWKDLISMLGKRDYYTRRIGRYESEILVHDKLGEANWLGAVGRNIVVRKDLVLQFPFFEFTKMGFEDLEFAYRIQQLGKKISLKNHLDLACLHIFHSSNSSKQNHYIETFNDLVKKGKLPIASKNILFPS
ncbi:glycosyltransferase family A protein [Candidatus Protochlamydia sp. W-9]|uniref:glycosyltransferase family A protein n=1 Tax=Candidatus Protochlamydia sp. W-9 TaxID=1785087 RepID=UPI00130151C2|nr:glycosyltransferase family A protein [Candidatus Protochlamydia sp. W-9]